MRINIYSIARYSDQDKMRKKTTTVQVDLETRRTLNELKIMEREPYDSVIRRLITFFNENGGKKKEK